MKVCTHLATSLNLGFGNLLAGIGPKVVLITQRVANYTGRNKDSIFLAGKRQSPLLADVGISNTIAFVSSAASAM
jgi:hypothetical protein